MNDVDAATRHQAALAYLRGRLDYERSPAANYSERTYKLDRIAELLARLGDPQRQMPIVHVAGTKGKGSTAAMIASILMAAGYRVGVFSSPHLFRVEERMAIDGQPCSAAELAALVELVAAQVRVMEADALDGGSAALANATGGDTVLPVANSGSATSTCVDGGPTYFEITTAMALAHFARRKVDVAVLEVGMGGRLDSTNVCQPIVSVITSISFDHTKELGPTLAHIATEKAGIIKPGVPAISGVAEIEPRTVIREKCRQEASTLWELGRDFQFAYRPPRHMESATTPAEIDFTAPDGEELKQVGIQLVGRHQGANAAVALATIYRLRELGFRVDESAIRGGLAQASCPARVQVLGRHPTVVVDAAHNVASVQALIETLDESFAAARRYLIFATTREKDVAGMLRLLLPRFEQILLTRYISNPRGIPPEELAEIARFVAPESSDRVTTCQTPLDALAQLRKLAQGNDLVCIAGSFFLAADVHDELLERPLSVRLV